MKRLFPFQYKRHSVYRGSSLPEYGLILALIALFCIAAITFLSDQFAAMCNYLGNTFASTVTTSGPGAAGTP